MAEFRPFVSDSEGSVPGGCDVTQYLCHIVPRKLHKYVLWIRALLCSKSRSRFSEKNVKGAIAKSAWRFLLLWRISFYDVSKKWRRGLPAGSLCCGSSTRSVTFELAGGPIERLNGFEARYSSTFRDTVVFTAHAGVLPYKLKTMLWWVRNQPVCIWI